jgi:hypothetical protein
MLQPHANNKHYWQGLLTAGRMADQLENLRSWLATRTNHTSDAERWLLGQVRWHRARLEAWRRRYAETARLGCSRARTMSRAMTKLVQTPLHSCRG